MLKQIIILIILLFAFTPDAKSKALVPQRAGDKVIIHQRDTQPKPEQLRYMTSRKNLLGLTRETPHGLPITLSAQEDSLRILVLKVQFQLEFPDDPTTTGNGQFDLRSYEEFKNEEDHEFDPAPHNTSYFSAHMRALNRYWFNISDHRLRLTWDIYPQEETSAFTLPNRMSYYGSEGPWADSGVVLQLGAFFKDAILLADSLAPQINFSEYDSYIIFHAGSDQQNNLYFVEDTPNDFYTGFIWTADTTIKVDSGTFEVHEAVLMPETASQDNRVTVLNAVMAHEFGHQLGLIDLYNTSNMLTTVGNFSLMDNNGMSIVIQLGEFGALVSGVMPVFPDAWSRAYLGFSGVTEVASGDDIAIPAAEQLHHANEVIKVPISDYEYFLIENRRYNADFRYLNFSNNDTLYIDADPVTGVILGPVYGYYYGDSLITFDSFEYDYLLPGDGLLIWHVDETVAYMDYSGSGINNFVWNTLQWDPNRRFLSLVEADGINDFGGNYVSWGYYGIDEDFFKEGNNTDLTSSTRPDSRSNLGADTHISITDISESDTLMTCNIAIDWLMDGFPVMGFPDLGGGENDLLAVDIDSDNAAELLTARGMLLLAVNYDGSPVIEADSSLNIFYLPDFNYDTLTYISPVFAMLDTNISGNIAAGDFDGDDSLEIACFDVAGKLYYYKGQDLSPADGRADLMNVVQLLDTMTAGPVAFDLDNEENMPDDEIIAGFGDSVIRAVKYIATDSVVVIELDTLNGIPLEITISDNMLFAVCDNSDNLYLYTAAISEGALSGQSIIALPSGEFSGLVCGDIDRDSTDDVIVTTSDNLCIYNGATQMVKIIHVDNPGAPALGDINSDGYPDIVLIAGDDFVTAYAFNYNGVLFDGFPARITMKDSIFTYLNQPLVGDLDSDHDPEIIISYTVNKPLVLDINGDGVIDICTDISVGGLSCINNHGDILAGFPLATSTGLTAEPVTGDFDGDGDIEIAVIDSSGFFMAWDIDAEYNAIDQPWQTVAGDISRTGFLSPTFLKPVSPLNGFLPDKFVYNYPNPASDKTTFRYYVDRPANINIKIFDMSGELVDELNDNTLGGSVPDEIEWDCSAFASGVYFARIEAETVSRDMTKNNMIKVALIK